MSFIGRVARLFYSPKSVVLQAQPEKINEGRRHLLQLGAVGLGCVAFRSLTSCGPEVNRPAGSKNIDIFGINSQVDLADFYGKGALGDGRVNLQAVFVKTSVNGYGKGYGKPFLFVHIDTSPKIQLKDYYRGSVVYSSNGQDIILRADANVLLSGNEKLVPVAEKIWFEGSDNISKGLQEVFLVIERKTGQAYRALRGNDGIYYAIDANNIKFSSANQMEFLPIAYPLMYILGENVLQGPKPVEWILKPENRASLSYAVKNDGTKIALEQVWVGSYSGTITGSEIGTAKIQSDGKPFPITRQGTRIPLIGPEKISGDTEAKIQIGISIDLTDLNISLGELSEKFGINPSQISQITCSGGLLSVSLFFA